MDRQTIATYQYTSDGSVWWRELSLALLSYSASSQTVSSACTSTASGASVSETSAITGIVTRSTQKKVDAVIKLIGL